jgi:hypothetical protein
MPRNMTGGKGAKKRKNKPVDKDDDPTKTPFKDPEQDYGYVIDELGDRRFKVRVITPAYLSNKTDRNSSPEVVISRVRGKLNSRKSGKGFSVKKGSYVLISKVDFQSEKAHIIHLYRTEEVEYLKKKKQIPYSLDDPNSKSTGSKIIFKRKEIETNQNSDPDQNLSDKNYLDLEMNIDQEDIGDQENQEEDLPEYDDFGNLIKAKKTTEDDSSDQEDDSSSQEDDSSSQEDDSSSQEDDPGE